MDKKNGVGCENWPFSEVKELDLKSSVQSMKGLVGPSKKLGSSPIGNGTLFPLRLIPLATLRVLGFVRSKSHQIHVQCGSNSPFPLFHSRLLLGQLPV